MNSFVAVFGVFAIGLSQLDLIQAGCSDICDSNSPYISYFGAINNGPCFNYGSKVYCIRKGTSNSVYSCTEKDASCKLLANPPDCGKASPSANNGMGVSGGIASSCKADSYKEDCANDKKFYKCAIADDHTMVNYCGAGSACGEVCDYGIPSQADIDRILKKHNDLRSRVAMGKEDKGFNMKDGEKQPMAKNMQKLKWNPELAKVAQRWAATCIWGHDKGSQRMIKGVESVGQNAWKSWSSAPYQSSINWESMVQSWYNEVNDMNPQVVNKFGSGDENLVRKKANGKFKPIGHYTQVIWAGTTEVGCGYIGFKNGDGYQRQFVCNYAKAGNMVGAKIYEVAATASEIGSSCKNGVENGLCL